MLLGTLGTHASNITLEQAKTVGAYYLSVNSCNSNLTAADMQLVYQADNEVLGIPAAYFLNAPKEGWIIIGGSTLLDPVIGYSEHGTLDVNRLPENMMFYLEEFFDMVRVAQEAEAEGGKYVDSPEWLQLMGNDLKSNDPMSLVYVAWGQGDGYYPTYNYYCPQLNGQTSVTGCVATALAQMCWYNKYPKNPTGSVNYRWTTGNTRLAMDFDTVHFDYSLMPPQLNSGSSEAQVKEVAKLCYAIGVGVKMDYDPDGSAANNQDARAFMSRNFKYTNAIEIARSSVGDTTFCTYVRNELMDGRLVYMTGASSIGGDVHASGHAWLVTGYMSEKNDKYEMNWGWDGSGNGWFNLLRNVMKPNSRYNFNQYQSIFSQLMVGDPEDGGIAETDKTALGEAYPNPASLNVMLPYATPVATDMLIYSIDGKLLSSHPVQPGVGSIDLRVDNLPAGIYIYRMNSVSKKFIVQ
jgi:hypothetical protein